MIYRFRVILDNDTEEDVFRDLEIRETDTMEDLHNIITQSFGFDGLDLASFVSGKHVAKLQLTESFYHHHYYWLYYGTNCCRCTLKERREELLDIRR